MKLMYNNILDLRLLKNCSSIVILTSLGDFSEVSISFIRHVRNSYVHSLRAT
jgi:hypothetical protein